MISRLPNWKGKKKNQYREQALDAGRTCFITDKIVFPPRHPADFEREHELCASLARAHSPIRSLWCRIRKALISQRCCLSSLHTLEELHSYCHTWQKQPLEKGHRRDRHWGETWKSSLEITTPSHGSPERVNCLQHEHHKRAWMLSLPTWYSRLQHGKVPKLCCDGDMWKQMLKFHSEWGIQAKGEEKAPGSQCSLKWTISRQQGELAFTPCHQHSQPVKPTTSRRKTPSRQNVTLNPK